MARSFGVAIIVVSLLLPAAAKPWTRPNSFVCSEGNFRADYCSKKGCMTAEPILLKIRPNGAVQWNGTTVDRKTLLSYLQSAVSDSPQSLFILQSAGDVSYATFARVVLTLQRLGIKYLRCEVPRA